MKFLLFVEGPTEELSLPAFLKRWLDPQLSHSVGVQTVKFNGWSDFRRGVKRKAHLHLSSPKRDGIVAVIGLIDLYGPAFYPDCCVTDRERFEWAKSEIEQDVDHPKFRQFFAVHETEAWLLSQPELFPPDVRKALPGRVEHPESVNFESPPSKLLDRLYRERLKRTYKKTTHGKELFDRLDPSVAYAKCPRLKEMLDEMFALAKAVES